MYIKNNRVRYFFILLVIAGIIASCRHHGGKTNSATLAKGGKLGWLVQYHQSLDSIAIRRYDSIKLSKINKARADSNKPYIPKKLVPVAGYRFVITGDFNGDGKTDTLVEHYFNKLTGKETNKAFDSLEDYDTLVSLTVHNDPYSFVLCSDKSIDTLNISDNPQLLGLAWLHNEGDLDGDGGDEIGYVIDWADWSSVNTYHIASYKNGKWVDLFSFMIHDWQLPQLPQMVSEYGLFGMDRIETLAHNDTINKQIEDTLKAFPGMITKLKNGKIKIPTYTYDFADDSALIFNLKHPPKSDEEGRWEAPKK
jgi:hypothetical protein